MKIQITLSILLAAALIGGCKSSTTVEDNDLGTLRGKVALSDVLCNPIVNASGVSVHIQEPVFLRSRTLLASGKSITFLPAFIMSL